MASASTATSAPIRVVQAVTIRVYAGRSSPLPILILIDGRPRRWRTGEGGPARASKRQEAAMKDPVCGMEVDPAKAAGTSEYQGTTYYFCAKSCKTKFDANPKQYVK